MAFSRMKSVPLVSRIFLYTLMVSFILIPSHRVSAQYLPSSSRSGCDGVYGRTMAERIISTRDRVDSLEDRLVEIDALIEELSAQKSLFDRGKVRSNDLSCNCNAVVCPQQMLADLGIDIPPLKQATNLRFVGWKPPVDPRCPKTYANSTQGVVNSTQEETQEELDNKQEEKFENRVVEVDCDPAKDPDCDPKANKKKITEKTAADYKCTPIFAGQAPDYDLDAYGHLKLCTKIYEAGKQQAGRVISTCWDRVTRCGQMAIDERRKELENDLLVLKEERRALTKKLSVCASARDRLVASCPNCADDANRYGEGGSDKPHWAEIAVAGIQALTPVALGYMGNRMAFKYMNTSLDMYNAHLDSSLQAYQAQVQQCITLGIPCGPYQGSGGYSGFSLNGMGSMGGMMGGGFNPMMGGMMGGGFNPMMGGMMGGGFNPMMGGMMGGGFNPMMGNSMFNGGFGMQDPSYMLQMQRSQMDQRNMMLAQQQMMEAQFRYQQMQNSMYSFGGGGFNPMMGGGFNPMMGSGLNFGASLNLGGNLGGSFGTPWMGNSYVPQSLGTNGFPANGNPNPFLI